MEMATANVVLQIGTDRLEANMSVPTAPISIADLMPIARGIMAKVLQVAEERVVEEGKTVSCQKGCGACCRQLVPISETEARMIVDLVEQMPEPRRTEIRDRFQRAKEKMEATGYWDRLRDRAEWSPEDVQKIGVEYFHLGIPCPFLEEESCSIHLDRPLTCREYLVTSPAENCARPQAHTIDQVPISLKVWPAIAKFDAVAKGQRFLRWVPLSMVLDWAAEAPKPPSPRPGPELLKEFFEHLTGKPIPGQPVPPSVTG